jgi:hypothetical protein
VTAAPSSSSSKTNATQAYDADMNPISPKFLIARGCLTLLLIAGAAVQDSAQAKSYPEHGKVIAAHLGIETVGSAGVVGSLKRWVYRVDGGNLYYDLQGNRKPSLTIGQDIDFRIEKEKAYLKGDKKETRYRVVGMGKPDQKPSSELRYITELAEAHVSLTHPNQSAPIEARPLFS